MYEFIFKSQFTTTVAGLVVTIAACALVARTSFWWRALALNFGPALAAGFMAAILLSDERFTAPDVLAALTFEIAVLCLFCRMAFLAYRTTHTLEAPSVTRALQIATLLYIASLLPAVLGGGFGIFSIGTRIDYLYESSSAKYFTYMGLMMVVLLGGLLARRITLNRKPRLFDYATILVVSAASIVAGSKGGFVLWIGAVLGFIDYRAAKIRPQTILFTLTAITGLVAVLAVVVSEFLRLSIPEFFELAFNRFFVNNDARAMAFDLRTLEVDPGLSLMSEAFRSLSSLFGDLPRNSPLGVELYDRYFGPSGGAGANASLVAIAIYYTAPGYAALPLLLAILATGLFALLINAACEHMPTAFSRFAIQMLATLNVGLLSQDFLAFQVVFPLTVILAMLFYISESFHVLAPQRR